MTLVVAFHVPHNDGTEIGIIDGPGFDTDTRLVDLYEVDGQIRSFATRQEAEAWLSSEVKGHPPLTPTTGGAYLSEEP